MAIVDGPLFSGAASGTVGALNYTRWRGRAVVRSTFTPNDANSGLQQAWRAQFANVIYYWNTTLTMLQRSGWEAVAATLVWHNRLGNKVVPTGYQLFCRISLNRIRQGSSISASIPDLSPPWLITGTYASWDPLLLNLDVGVEGYVGVNPPPGYQIWLAGPYTSGARTALRHEYRWLYNKSGVNDYAITGLVASRYYWVKIRWIDYNGLQGNWFPLQAYTN